MQRCRNDPLLRQLGLDLARVSGADMEASYGRFEARTPLLARGEHGYQFSTYNPLLCESCEPLLHHAVDLYQPEVPADHPPTEAVGEARLLAFYRELDELVPFVPGAPDATRQPWLTWRDAW